MALVYTCPHCGKQIGGWEVACPHCGKAITPAFAAPQFAPAPQPAAAPGDSTARQILKLLLAIWAVAYPVISCGPFFATGSAGTAAGGGLLGLVLGSVLFFPWVIGIVVLGVLVAVSK